jgi:hypothetical protein
MKKISKISASILLTIILTVASLSLYAQPGGVPNDPSLPDAGTPTNGAVGHPVGAALASGLYILLLLGGVYGSYKLYDVKQKKDQEQID